MDSYLSGFRQFCHFSRKFSSTSFSSRNNHRQSYHSVVYSSVVRAREEPPMIMEIISLQIYWITRKSLFAFLGFLVSEMQVTLSLLSILKDVGVSWKETKKWKGPFSGSKQTHKVRNPCISRLVGLFLLFLSQNGLPCTLVDLILTQEL